MRPGEPVVALANVRVLYDGAVVLDVPALEAWPGEVLAVIGPNGSGKSTLLRVIGLLEAPTAGEVRLDGRAVVPGRALAARRRMATVFQQPLLADMTVADNVALGLRFRGVPAADGAARVGRWLERFGLAALGERRAPTLSGGEARRVALARALVLEPELLLLDEPFTGLDEPSRAALIADLAGILRDARLTTILVTHDRNEAQALADRVAVMIGGCIRQIDATARVFRMPVSEEVGRFVGVETMVPGEVVGVDGGLTVVAVAGARVEVAEAARPGERVRVCVRPEDVTLWPAASALAASGAGNRLAGAVTRVTPFGVQTHVLVDCGFLLTAAVTPHAVEDLELREGARVTAGFTASAAHLIRLQEPVICGLDNPSAEGAK